jgi:hypothetical protein
MTAKTTPTPAAKAPAKAPAKKATPKPDAVPMETCPAGNHKVPVRSFPTTRTATGRSFKECRACRDARWTAAKAAKASA